jgi:hypothetical protein
MQEKTSNCLLILSSSISKLEGQLGVLRRPSKLTSGTINGCNAVLNFELNPVLDLG